MPTIPAYWLTSAPRGIRYHFLTKYAESFAHDTNVSIPAIECAFEDAGLLKRDFFGDATYIAKAGVTPRLSRNLPLQSGYYDSHYIQRMDLEGFQAEYRGTAYTFTDLVNAKGFMGLDGYAQYKLTFGNFPYNHLTDAEVDALAAAQNALSPFSCAPEMFRFLRLTRRYLPESRKTPAAGFEVYDDGTGPALVHPVADLNPPMTVLEVGSMPTFQVEIIAETILWPLANFPDRFVASMLGTVNIVPIYLGGVTYPAGTLLYKGPGSEITPYRWIDSNFYVDVPHLFGFRPQGWNNHRMSAPVAADGGRQFYPVRVKGVAGNVPQFQSDYHSYLFQPEASH